MTGEVLSTLRIVVHGETLGGSDAEVEASPPDADNVLIDAVDVVLEEERVPDLSAVEIQDPESRAALIQAERAFGSDRVNLTTAASGDPEADAAVRLGITFDAAEPDPEIEPAPVRRISPRMLEAIG